MPPTCVPRVRGDEPFIEGEQKADQLVFPAYAGMNRWLRSTRRMARRVPRVRGDEPTMNNYAETYIACSPRTRG